jgi:hypothetical protein
LETLNKLADTKAKNGQTTALDYVVQVITKAHPELLDFDQEIASVPVAAKRSSSLLIPSLTRLCAVLTMFEHNSGSREYYRGCEGDG